MTFFSSRVLPWGVFALLTACSDPEKPIDDAGGGSGGTLSSTGGHGGSSGSGGTGGSSGGGSSGGGSSGTGGIEPMCNQQLLEAPDYVMTMDPGMPPAAKGGDIFEGLYFLERTICYGQTGSDLPMGRTQFVIVDGIWQTAEDMDSSGEDDTLEPTRHFTYTATPSGTSVSLVQTCPTPDSADTQTFEYTADFESLTLYIVDHGEHFAQVLALQ